MRATARPFEGASVAPIQAALLAWYARHQRDLPWRRPPLADDPYAILVSEVMLQQTPVGRVIPKYREFLQRFPTFEALAAASPGEVIRSWAPLGYNRRAVRLWRVAQRVAAEHGGRLPQDPATLRGLDGIGEYTASALECFAFGQQVAVVDINAQRALGRLAWGLERPEPRELRRVAQGLLPSRRASDWNQALMDLGATICTSRRPHCAECPLRPHCRAEPALNGPTAIAEARGKYKAAPFKGSSRYYRGRILHELRKLAPEERLPIRALGGRVKPDFDPHDAPWLEELVAGLERDGLAKRARGADGGPSLLSLP